MTAKNFPRQFRHLGSALLWGMVEFLALQRVRRLEGRACFRNKRRHNR
jgi:hypothetical protein